MAAGKNMYEVLWERMDELYTAFQSLLPYGMDECREVIAEMKGIAFAIQNWSAPFLQGEKAVSKLAMERYRAIAAGRQLPDTPGVAGYNPLPPGNVHTAPPVKDPKAGLTDMTVSQIIKGLDAGFPAADMASLYKVELSVVEAIRKGAAV